MKIKKLILCIIILCMTGCTVEYHLEFHDDIFIEKIKINQWDESITDAEVESTIETELGSNHEDYTFKFNQQAKEIKLTRKYNIDNYRRAPLLRQCYKAYNILEDKDSYEITTSEEFTCNIFDYMKIDHLEIHITTNHKVISHNADRVISNHYIWDMSSSDTANKPIRIKFDKAISTNSKIGLIIIVGIAIIITIVLLIFFYKKKHTNKI